MAVFTELSLFSGAGGGLLATTHLLGWRTVCYVEWDKYAVEVLKARIRDGYLHDAPIWDDAFTFDGRPWAGLVDVVTAGFPCQPFSLAGKGLAENDPRNGWPAVIRILREVRPRYAFLENVPGLISKPYYRRILGELVEEGFDIEQDCISAEEMGANHKRERLWIVATHANRFKRSLAKIAREREEEIHTDGNGVSRFVANTDLGKQTERGERADVARQGFTGRDDRSRSDLHVEREESVRGAGEGEEVPDADGGRRGQFYASRVTGDAGQPARGADARWRGEWWAVEPSVGRVANGVAHRVDRLRVTGNGQVPDVVEEAWTRLSVPTITNET